MSHRIAAVCASSLVALLLAGCSDSSSPKKDVVPDSGYGTDSLDALTPAGSKDTARTPEPIPEPESVEIDQSAPDDTARTDEDPEREWVKERESRSLLGKSRDKAKTLRNDIQGGTDAPENGFAATTYEEEWVGAAGCRWDMPEDWKMAIPGSGRFGEMYIQSPLGAASVAFTKETDRVEDLQERVASMLVDMIGSRVKPRTETFDVDGVAVRTLALEGTYIDPSGKGGGNEKPFYAVRAAIVDLGEQRVLIVMWGPEDSVKNNQGKFEAMVRGMHRG